MNFASTTSSNLLIEVSDLNVRFRSEGHHPRTIRDLFVRTLSNPLGFFQQAPDFAALRDFSFSMDRGDRVAILGRNGSGKTTLCRVLAGCNGSRNEIRMSGSVRGVFGSTYALYPDLSGLEN